MSRFILASLIFAISSVWPTAGMTQAPAPVQCFPEEIENLHAVKFPSDRQEAVRKYRNSHVVGYNAAEFNTAVTVYIYDREPITELTQEFRLSGSEVIDAHKGSESPMNGPSKLTISDNPVDGFLGVFLWSEGETDFGSFLWVGEISGKYVKLRTTYIRPEKDEETGPAMLFAMSAMKNVAKHVCVIPSQAQQ